MRSFLRLSPHLRRLVSYQLLGQRNNSPRRPRRSSDSFPPLLDPFPTTAYPHKYARRRRSRPYRHSQRSPLHRHHLLSRGHELRCRRTWCRFRLRGGETRRSEESLADGCARGCGREWLVRGAGSDGQSGRRQRAGKENRLKSQCDFPPFSIQLFTQICSIYRIYSFTRRHDYWRTVSLSLDISSSAAMLLGHFEDYTRSTRNRVSSSLDSSCSRRVVL